jgi:DNA-binding beta-propeller fold protein YncE
VHHSSAASALGETDVVREWWATYQMWARYGFSFGRDERNASRARSSVVSFRRALGSVTDETLAGSASAARSCALAREATTVEVAALGTVSVVDVFGTVIVIVTPPRAAGSAVTVDAAARPAAARTAAENASVITRRMTSTVEKASDRHRPGVVYGRPYMIASRMVTQR